MEDKIVVTDKETGKRFDTQSKNGIAFKRPNQPAESMDEAIENFEVAFKNFQNEFINQINKDVLRLTNPFKTQRKSGRFYWSKKSRNFTRTKRR